MNQIILSTINAKWIHPSLALRLLKANLGSLENSCDIIEFALRQPLCEKTEPLLAAMMPNGYAKILGISVSIWNHLATLELLKELDLKFSENKYERPIIVLGGPEVSHLPEDAEIFKYTDYVIRGEGEIAFRLLCEDIFAGGIKFNKFINAQNVDVCEIKTAYHLYSNEDITKKLIYVEASRGCAFNCEFCLSAVKSESEKGNAVREFPLEPFFAEMDILIKSGVKTFKFLDRSININPKRSIQIIEFFLEKIRVNPRPSADSSSNVVVHFEMVPSIFPQELLEVLTHFPPGTLRLEIGIQTLNPEIAARIGRICNPEKELAALCYLREKTNAIIHADLIAGLPGEDLTSFGRGFDMLWNAIAPENPPLGAELATPKTEIQLGILKQLPGAPISRCNDSFKMRYNRLPPYEIEETSMMSAKDLQRLKNFARFWELIINRGLKTPGNSPIFEKFMAFSDELYASFSKNWGINKAELLEKVSNCNL